jgi:hypothetical protein
LLYLASVPPPSIASDDARQDGECDYERTGRKYANPGVKRRVGKNTDAGRNPDYRRVATSDTSKNNLHARRHWTCPQSATEATAQTLANEMIKHHL